MIYFWIFLGVLLLPVVVDAVFVAVRELFRPRDDGGDAGAGLVIFVESIRWLGVRWGIRSVSAGLRRAGFLAKDGEFLYWRWHATWRGWLVLPVIMDAGLLEAQARRLAAFVVEQSRVRPGRPISLIGYSCGGYVTVRALELLPPEVSVRSVVLLAAACDPRRDLRDACSRVQGRVVNVSSWLDWLILGVGTLLFGTGDRRHAVSAGLCGFRASHRPSNLVERRWRPAMLRHGHFGGHFSASSSWLMAEIWREEQRRGDTQTRGRGEGTG